MQRDKDIPDRFIWAFEFLQLKGSESILEIGCGAGLLATLIAGKLHKGKITALDKSKPMSEKAATRLEKFVNAGRAEVVGKDFNDFNSDVPFDKVVAFNVNFFWKDESGEFEVLKKHIHKRSLLFIFYDAPGKVKSTVIDGIKGNLLKHDFHISEVAFMNHDRSVCCVKAAPQ